MKICRENNPQKRESIKIGFISGLMAFIGCYALMRAYPVIDVLCVNKNAECSVILKGYIASYLPTRAEAPAWLQAIGAVVIVGLTYFNWRNDRQERQRVESFNKTLREFSVSVRVQDESKAFLEIKWLKDNLELCLFDDRKDNVRKFYSAACSIKRVSIPAARLMADLARDVGENPYLLYTGLVELNREVGIGEKSVATTQVLRDVLGTIALDSLQRAHMNERLQVVISRMQDAWQKLSDGSDGMLGIFDNVPLRPPEANPG